MEYPVKKHLIDDLLSLRQVGFDEVVILGTGPSICEAKAYLSSLDHSHKTLIIALKQAIDFVPPKTSYLIHLINPFNLQKYEYKDNNLDPLTIYYHDQYAKYKPDETISDHTLLVAYDKAHQLAKSVLTLRAFDAWLYRKGNDFLRPVMPGILGEAFYLTIFLNIKTIKLFGVDYMPHSSGVGANDHFYDNSLFLTWFLKNISRIKFVKKIFYKIGLKSQYAKCLPDELEVSIPGYTDFIKYMATSHGIECHGWKHG